MGAYLAVGCLIGKQGWAMGLWAAAESGRREEAKEAFDWLGEAQVGVMRERKEGGEGTDWATGKNMLRHERGREGVK